MICRSLVYASSRQLHRSIAAIDRQIAPDDETRTIAGEKNRRGRNLLWPAEPAQQVLCTERLPGRLKEAPAAARLRANSCPSPRAVAVTITTFS